MLHWHYRQFTHFSSVFGLQGDICTESGLTLTELGDDKIYITNAAVDKRVHKLLYALTLRLTHEGLDRV